MGNDKKMKKEGGIKPQQPPKGPAEKGIRPSQPPKPPPQPPKPPPKKSGN